MVLLAVLVADAAGAADSVRVTADRVNLRSEPNTTSRVITKVDKGTVLEVLGREGGWVRVTAPGGGTAYISASLCETVASAPPPAPAAASQPPAAEPAAAARPTRSSGSSGEREPLRFGPHVSFADKGIDFGVGARVSTGLTASPRLGALVTFDYLFGAASSEDAAGVEVEVDGHSIQLGVFPTYSFDVGGGQAYAGAGLSYLRTTVTASVSAGGETVEASGSASSTSLGIVAGARFRERFFSEARYHFGDASHLTISVGVLFTRSR